MSAGRVREITGIVECMQLWAARAPLMSDARSISSRFPLRRKSGAHRLKIGPSLLTYLFSKGTHVSIYDVSPLDGSPSAISAHSRPPLLASGSHSIGFRMVVCCFCIDLT